MDQFQSNIDRVETAARIASERTSANGETEVAFPLISPHFLGSHWLVLVNSVFLSPCLLAKGILLRRTIRNILYAPPNFHARRIARTALSTIDFAMSPHFRSSSRVCVAPSSVFLSSSPVRIILQNSLPSSSSSEDDRRQDASTEDDQPISKVGRKRELREMRKHRFDLHPRKPNGTPVRARNM